MATRGVTFLIARYKSGLKVHGDAAWAHGSLADRHVAATMHEVKLCSAQGSNGAPVLALNAFNTPPYMPVTEIGVQQKCPLAVF